MSVESRPRARTRRHARVPGAAARLAAGLLTGLLAACAGGPPPPAWQLDAQGAIERAMRAHLEGNGRVEEAEFGRARAAAAASGQPALAARLELMRCAARVAALQFERCDGFERLREDAAPAERAYADYLEGRAGAAQAEALPAAQRAALAAGEADAAAVLGAIDAPLSRLVAAAVMLRSGRAGPQAVAAAVDTASAQGWRRALLAWLKLQQSLAEKAGDAPAAAAIGRRIALVEGR